MLVLRNCSKNLLFFIPSFTIDDTDKTDWQGFGRFPNSKLETQNTDKLSHSHNSFTSRSVYPFDTGGCFFFIAVEKCPNKDTIVSFIDINTTLFTRYSVNV